MSSDSTLLKQTLGWGVIAAICVAAGTWAGHRAHLALLFESANRAQRKGASFVPGELVTLTGTDEDVASPAFASVKERLQRLQRTDPAVRLIFIARARSAADAMILADSVPGKARLGDEPAEQAARISPAFRQAVLMGQQAAEPPAPSRGADTIVSVAPIGDPNYGSTTYFIGVEQSAEGWNMSAVAAFCEWAFDAAVLMGVPFGLILMRSRHREQRAALRNLSEAMEQTHSAVMIVNADGRIEYANAGLTRQIGYSRRDLIGKHWRDFQQPETPPEMIADMVASVRSGRVWHGEWFNRRKNGELYTVRGDISPVHTRDQRLISFVAIFEDMTDQKRAEANMRAALDRAEAGDRAKSQFLATMSHEVRTPLNGIVGFTSLLAELPLGAEAGEYVQTIRTSAEALIQLTGDILDFAKIETGGIKLELQPANPRTIVEDTLELFATQAAIKQLELCHWIEEDVPAAILGDESRLRQILANLVGNAVKFTAKGAVTVEVRVESTTPSRLEFRVRDTGIGIAVDQQNRLFKPFRQVDDTTTRKFGGTGLGLAISRNLAQLMGGDIRLESEPGKGSTFIFVLPTEPLANVPRIPPQLREAKLVLAARPGPFRDEFQRLAGRWNTPCHLVDTAEDVVGTAGDFACVELDEADARALAQKPAGALGWPAGHAFGIVPVGLPNELRTSLIAHFRQLVNKPLRHDAFAMLIAGAAAPPPAPRTPPRQFGLNVLVVEDNIVNQRLVQRLLTTLGCASTVAGNGLIGLDCLRGADVPFDLILMDLHMPELDGVGAIQQIRKGAAGPQVTAIWITVLTADARVEQKEKVYEAGANDYLVKPVSLSDLAVSLQRHVDGRRAAAV